MTDDAFVNKDIVVVTTLVSLIAKEVNLLIILKVFQAVGFVPAFGKGVEADLSAYCEPESVVGKLLFNDVYELFTDFVHLVVLVEVFALLLRAVPANWRNVDQPCAVLNEGSALYWNLQVSNIQQTEINKLLKPLFTQKFPYTL
eukprot:TRINITY_DN7322_c0_g4_i1.p1 TRINITY_DN7322_c0_g4~~TRINITY_DN7322_c0_g4_i1.p1  ORF type:complete len:144 (-),score=8.42 TRINITY_DN7322_c0_g4_i1:449-880(-)